jgi:hypothetical protein
VNARTIALQSIVALLALGPPAVAQVREQQRPPARDNAPAATGTASIAGTVLTDTEPARPLRRAIVTINSSDRTIGKTTVSDDNGRFVVTGLPAARYSVGATKRGWVGIPYGAKGPNRPGTTIPLTDGQRATVTLRAVRGAVITGTIHDESGQPPGQVSVNVTRYQFISGERRLTTAGAMSSGPDERGVYRLYGLSPGDYYIVVSGSGGGPFRTGADLHLTSDVDVQQAALAIQGGSGVPIADVPQRPVTVAPVYYPGVHSSAEATAVTVRAGEERSGVDIVVSYVGTAHVEGTVTGVDGAPTSSSMITLVNTDLNATVFGFEAIHTARTDGNGHFSFSEITPGSYIASARGGTPGGWAMSDVDVQGEDVRGVSLALQETFTVGGTLRFDGASNVPPLTNVRVSLSPQPSTSGVVISSGTGANATADGRFTITGVSPGRYRLNAFVPSGRPTWTVRSATLGGQDALDAFIDVRQPMADGAVVFTDQLADLTGNAAPDSTLVLFASNPALVYPQSRRMTSTRASGDGSYQFKNLPPGEYYLAVADVDEVGQLMDPAYLQTLIPSATRITIAEGEKKTIDIK